MYAYHLIPYTSRAPHDIELRVPKNRFDGEEDSLPRICVSKSLDGCLTSIGPHNVYLPYLQDKCKRGQTGTETGQEHIRFPFILRTYKIRFLDALLGRFWDTSILSKFVPDAAISQECWIVKPMRPESIQVIWLEDAKIQMQDLELDGELCDYPVFCGSKWSDTVVEPTEELESELRRLTKRVIKQFQKDEEKQKVAMER